MHTLEDRPLRPDPITWLWDIVIVNFSPRLSRGQESSTSQLGGSVRDRMLMETFLAYRVKKNISGGGLATAGVAHTTAGILLLFVNYRVMMR